MSKATAFGKKVIDFLKDQPAAVEGTAKALAKGSHAGSSIHSSFNKMPKRLQSAYRRQGTRSGADSFALAPLQHAAEKVKGAKTVRKAVWNYAQKPALKADMAGGKALFHAADTVMPTNWAKTISSVKEKVPTGKKTYEEVTRHAATAPLTHAASIAKPLVFGAAVERGVAKLRGEEKKAAVEVMKKIATLREGVVQSNSMDQQLREKVASTMLHLHEQNKGHEKRAHAIRLLFKQAANGVIELPKSFEEFNTKVAALLREDLAVVEKAIDFSGGAMKLGELDRIDLSEPQNATHAFQAAILGNEF